MNSNGWVCEFGIKGRVDRKNILHHDVVQYKGIWPRGFILKFKVLSKNRGSCGSQLSGHRIQVDRTSDPAWETGSPTQRSPDPTWLARSPTQVYNFPDPRQARQGCGKLFTATTDVYYRRIFLCKTINSLFQEITRLDDNNLLMI